MPSLEFAEADSLIRCSSGAEVEITPEMIEVGLAVVWGSPIDCPTEDDMRLMVRRVFSVMSKAR